MGGAPDSAISFLRSPTAVRQRCNAVLDFVLAGQSDHFSLDLARLPAAVDLTWQVTRQAYPDLSKLPLHSRINHFGVGAVDRMACFEALTEPLERARALTDLVVTSVLLDAGAGAEWQYVEPGTGLRL